MLVDFIKLEGGPGGEGEAGIENRKGTKKVGFFVVANGRKIERFQVLN